MEPSLHPDRLSFDDFTKHLSFYPSYLPNGITTLEESRRTTIPNSLAERKEARSSSADLWNGSCVYSYAFYPARSLGRSSINGHAAKRKFGTFRPTLLSLVKSNSDDTICNITKEAFSTFRADLESGSGSAVAAAKAVKHLSKLKGIGPATASLLLSVFDPEVVPFFSDELFRWLHYEGNGEKGFGRKIKYNAKEYEAIFERMLVLRGRLEKESGKGVTAEEIERVAFAIARSAQEEQKSVTEKNTTRRKESLLNGRGQKRAPPATDTKIPNARASSNTKERTAPITKRQRLTSNDRRQETRLRTRSAKAPPSV
ncbi:MAG: hypothetical protein Q9190_007252 [Brigantiaea leucoxantha]